MTCRKRNGLLCNCEIRKRRPRTDILSMWGGPTEIRKIASRSDFPYFGGAAPHAQNIRSRPALTYFTVTQKAITFSASHGRVPNISDGLFFIFEISVLGLRLRNLRRHGAATRISKIAGDPTWKYPFSARAYVI